MMMRLLELKSTVAAGAHFSIFILGTQTQHRLRPPATQWCQKMDKTYMDKTTIRFDPWNWGVTFQTTWQHNMKPCF